MISQSQIVHDLSARLVFEDSIHTRDGLHQTVTAHWLVDVHRTQARSVEAGQPHFLNNDDAERVVGIFESAGEVSTFPFGANMLQPVEIIAGRTVHLAGFGKKRRYFGTRIRPCFDASVVASDSD